MQRVFKLSIPSFLLDDMLKCLIRSSVSLSLNSFASISGSLGSLRLKKSSLPRLDLFPPDDPRAERPEGYVTGSSSRS